MVLCLRNVQGLEAQLLGIVVRKERPELEEQKDSLVISIASGRRSLQELEDEILRLSCLRNCDLSLVSYILYIIIIYCISGLCSINTSSSYSSICCSAAGGKHILNSDSSKTHLPKNQ